MKRGDHLLAPGPEDVEGWFVSIARSFQFFGSGLVLGSCFRVKNLPRFLEPVLEPSSVRFSVFYEESRIFLGIPDFCRYLSIFLNFLGLFGRFF